MLKGQKDFLRYLTALPVSVLALIAFSDQAVAERPNVLLIVSDDQGWSDVGFNGCREIPTPHLDRLAASGVVLEAGYVSHPYCSPSRAGLLTGRYQQRYGHECNPGILEETFDTGLPLSEKLLSNVLQDYGYRTGAVGKWHLGDAAPFQPNERGFDEWFGFSGGNLSYWGDLGNKPAEHGVVRNGKPVPESELTHLTDDFSDEAVRFLQEGDERPFFLYLAYNAPHSPDHATHEHLKRTEHIEYGGRAVYGAMVAAMDAGIGRVLDALKQRGELDNTLIFFLSDNGGRKEHATNYPYRGHKGMLFEGGIRVPFCVAWPQGIEGARRYGEAVSAIDIFPSILAATGCDQPDLALDGVNLLPYLRGEVAGAPHEDLYWRYACGEDTYGYAVRSADLKLVYSVYKERHLLFDLAADPWEQNNLFDSRKQDAERLLTKYEQWRNSVIDPLWLDPHGPNVKKEEARREAKIQAASQGER
ncbi:Arylsulfatase [Planctomycetes bacterium MalM25]|nr:Arylsulfatase [Planctomycetes bacterium MalM25]